MNTSTDSYFEWMTSEDCTVERGEDAQLHGGWRNSETWTVYRWIMNGDVQENWEQEARGAWHDAGRDKHLASLILADWLRDETELAMPKVAGMYCSLLLEALGEVDWYAIAAHILDDAKLGEVFDRA
jgi:hypothetical protein